MTHACDEEFLTIDLMIKSNCKSRGVDVFCLSWIKSERQLRKIIGYLIYQSRELNSANQDSLRTAFRDNRNISLKGAAGGIEQLTQTTVKTLIGEQYKDLRESLKYSYEIRQKVFHGQQTGDSLSREALLSQSKDIREWCKNLAISCHDRFGYDGFYGSTSLNKSEIPELTAIVEKSLENSEGWQKFIQNLR